MEREGKVLLDCVKVVPALAPYNLFSITKALEAGMDLGNVGRTLYLQKQDYKLTFDREIQTKSGYVGTAFNRTKRGRQWKKENATPALSKNQSVPLKQISWNPWTPFQGYNNRIRQNTMISTNRKDGSM